jgi:hypothetical protein
LAIPLVPAARSHFLQQRAGMSTLSNQNFGLMIAYLLPGFVSLWGVSYFSPTVDAWINTSQQGSPSVAGFMYVTLASLAAGVTVSAVRWALIDHLHHATGIVPPAWKFGNLEGKLKGYLTLIENHYRFYQFYSNTFVAGAFAYLAYVFSDGLQSTHHMGATVGFLVVEIILFAGSRDSLQKYYTRTQQLLDSHHP